MATFTVAELENMIVVNMGDYKTPRGEKKLLTKDLGSCVGVAVRDPRTGVGGLLHVMLPDHSIAKEGDASFVAAKYADSGLDEMIRVLVQQGAERSRMVAKTTDAMPVKMETTPSVGTANPPMKQAKLTIQSAPTSAPSILAKAFSCSYSSRVAIVE